MRAKPLLGATTQQSRGRTLEILAEVFEDRGIVGRHRREIVERLVGAGDDAGGRDVVAENAAIDHLREERRLRDQLVQQVRDVLLPVRHERLVVARASAEGDDNGFLSARRDHSAQRRMRRRCAAAAPAPVTERRKLRRLSEIACATSRGLP